MAKKISIVGDALVVTSELTLEQIKLLEKFDPKALYVYEADEDGHKQEKFRVATAKNGVINQKGACFASATRDDAKNATITLTIPSDVANAMDWAEDMIGVAAAYLATVEAQAKTALAAVAEKRKALRDSIQVI